MAPDADAIRRWAAAHAATVLAPGPASPAQPSPVSPAPPAPAEPVPAVLASFTQTRTWQTETGALGIGLGRAADGRPLLAVGEDSGAVRIWDPGTGQLLRTLTGHTSRVRTVAWGYLSDGRPLLATGGNDGAVMIWDPETGECRNRFADFIEHMRTKLVNAVAWGYRADGEPLLAVGCSDDTVRIWEPGNGGTLRALPGEGAWITSISWGHGHHGELLLVTGARDGIWVPGPRYGMVRIWDAATWETPRALRAHSGGVYAIAWTRRPRGQPLLATVGHKEEQIFRLWSEGDDGEFTAEDVDSPGQGPMRTVTWAPLEDGRLLLIGTSEGSLFVLDGHTLELLHLEPANFPERGLHNLDWQPAPDGSLLLCATSYSRQVHVWNITLDPPVQPPAVPSPAPPAERGQAMPSAGQQGVILDPPEDVTPRFEDHDGSAGDPSVRCAVRADGHVLLAADFTDGTLRIWDASTGALAGVLPQPGSLVVWPATFAWGHLPDGTLVLAFLGAGGTVQIWDAGAGEIIRSWQLDYTPVGGSLTWIHDRDGRPFLAITGHLTAERGTASTGVWICDPESGALIRSFDGDYSFAVIAAGWLTDGQWRLFTGVWNAPTQVWDPGTGELIGEFPPREAAREPRRHPWAAAWGHGPDGRPELALGHADGTIGIWDPGSGDILRTLTGHRRSSDSAYPPAVHSVVRTDQPGLPPILATAGADRTARIWDANSGAELARLPCGSSASHAIDLVTSPDGDLLLFIATGDSPDEHGPARVWRIATGPARAAGQATGQAGRLTAHRAGELARWLLRLGSGALWPPAGLLADLVTLTGAAYPDQAPPDAGGTRRPAPALSDPRLASLAGEPGIARLRELGWPPPARVAFAALLTSGIEIPSSYVPPPDAVPAGITRASEAAAASPAALADTLTRALSGDADTRGARTPWTAPLPALRTATSRITDQVITQLRILGPSACAADPVLPLRLAHYVPQLPALSPRELRLLAEAGQRRPRPANGGPAAAGTLAWSPGTAGLARSGPLTRLLPTQLALPRDLLTIRLAEDQLLYRQHRAPVPPAPEPVTIVLDTTPPTFGPAGQALRLAAHLITVTLWEHGRYPCLITLGDPGARTELRSTADLVRLWASGTLDGPFPALATALATAAASGRPTVLCTHHHTASGSYVPGQATRLLTAHQPPERPPRTPASPWHAHLPPNPAREQLTAAITRLLIPRAEDGR